MPGQCTHLLAQPWAAAALPPVNIRRRRTKPRVELGGVLDTFIQAACLPAADAHPLSSLIGQCALTCTLTTPIDLPVRLSTYSVLFMQYGEIRLNIICCITKPH